MQLIDDHINFAGKNGRVDSFLTKVESVINNPIVTFLSFGILYVLSLFGSNYDVIKSKLRLSRQAINSWIPEFLDNSKNDFHPENSEMLRQCLMTMGRTGAVGLQKPNFYHVFHYHVPVKKEHQAKNLQVHQMQPLHQVHQDNSLENADFNQFWRGTLAYPHFNQLKVISKTNPSQLFTDGSDLMFNEHGNDYIQKTRFSDFKNSLENFMVTAEDDGNKDLNDNLSNYERSESTATNTHQSASSKDNKKVKTKKDTLTLKD